MIELYTFQLDDENSIQFSPDAVPPELIQTLQDETRNGINFKQTINNRIKFGTFMPDNHLAANYTFNPEMYNIYQSGYGTNHVGQAIANLAETVPNFLHAHHQVHSLQDQLMCLTVADDIVTNGFTENLLRSGDGISLHFDGKAVENNTPIGTISWGKPGVVKIANMETGEIFEFITGSHNTMNILITFQGGTDGGTWYQLNGPGFHPHPGTYKHGKRLQQSLTPTEYCCSITFRQMRKNVTCKLLNKFKQFLTSSIAQTIQPDPFPFGPLNWNNLPENKPPPARAIIGRVKKSDKGDQLFRINKHIILPEKHHMHPIYWCPGDQFIGGPAALSILNLTNQPCGGSVGGTKKTGAVAIFLGDSGYQNYLRSDAHGWSLEFEVENDIQKQLMDASSTDRQMIRIFLSAASPFRMKGQTKTLYFADAYIINSEEAQKTQLGVEPKIYLLRNHYCPDLVCLHQYSQFPYCRTTSNLTLVEQDMN